MDLLSFTDLSPAPHVDHELAAVDVSRPVSVCKLVDAVDFFRPEVIAQIRRIGQEPRLHNKQWEYALQLEACERYAPRGGRFAGLGSGCELTIPLLAQIAGELTVTDLYGAPGAWGDAARRPDQIWPDLPSLRVQTMDMRRIDLPPDSFDFVSSLCAVEHVGRADQVVDTVRQAGRLLRPHGVLFVTTEYTFDDGSFYAPEWGASTLFLSKSVVRRLFTETGLHLVEPLDLRVSSHPLNVPVWDHTNNRLFPNVPHVLYRTQPFPARGTYGATIALTLSRKDHGADTMIEDPEQGKRLAPLFAMGRRMSRRLTLPTRWW
jgi:SAM-dependent methyltransferase